MSAELAFSAFQTKGHGLVEERWASVMERNKAKKMEKNGTPEVLEVEIAVLTQVERKK